MHTRTQKAHFLCDFNFARFIPEVPTLRGFEHCAAFNFARIKLRGNIAGFLTSRGSNSRIERLRVSPKPRNEFNLLDESDGMLPRCRRAAWLLRKSWSKLKISVENMRENFKTLERKPKVAREIAERREKRRAK
ncbi:hypothetical protein B0H16DRAFT_1477906 [Mycena metata]|uniref:Uncharacterized protein n=1 Tax=Mycena metata TaxID=1033252 RepID=A0AAD7H8I8_9AGAR|nr:hypothetical protein B0H16DRAFT_1477906 [Mycena metata]